MPYSNVQDAPKNIRSLGGKSLTLEQVNWIANVADGIPEGKVDNPWAVAIAQFKRAYKIDGNGWVKRQEEKQSGLYIEKQDDGRYEIVAVSTVALPDREGETFTTQAMDHEIATTLKEEDFPEFRAFHKKGLGIGKVTKMSRVGMFAVDSGYSYDDPFSLQVCEKMLVENDGRWKVSRGFKVFEVSGGCPDCGEDLLVRAKHMVVGFRCPSCGTVNMTYKGTLAGVQFRRTKTFDVTITDVPAVPYTGVQAFPLNVDNLSKELIMGKDTIRQKLLDAGIDEELVDARLKDVDDDVLKSLNIEAIPDALALKEFLDGAEDNGEKEEKEDEPVGDVLEIDDEALKQLADVLTVPIVETVQVAVAKQLQETLNGLEIEVGDMEGAEFEIKELPEVASLKDDIAELKEVIEGLARSEDERLKELMGDMPRNGKVRITRFKSQKEEDLEDEEEDEELEEQKQLERGVVLGGDGKKYGSMTELVKGD
jgi:phage FluMu protein Com